MESPKLETKASRRFGVVILQDPARSILFLFGLMTARALFQVYLYYQGFLSVSADEFARGITAAKWSQNPHWGGLYEFVQPWLPLEKYLNGLILSIWDDVLLVPRVTVFMASCLLLIVFYYLLRLLFHRFSVAAWGLIFISVQPWYIWLSGTPMLEMYFMSFFFLGLFFITAWLKDARKGYWLYAGLSFFMASGFHVQSWLLINLVNLLVFASFCHYLFTRRFGLAARLLAYFFLSNAFIFLCCIADYKLNGQILSFLSTHTQNTKWFYQGYEVGSAEKLLYYPKLINRNFTLLAWIFVAISLWLIRGETHRKWKLLPGVLLCMIIAAYSILNFFSVPPSSSPDRYSIIFLLLLAPYVAHGCSRIVDWAWGHQNKLLGITSLLVTAGLLGVILSSGLYRSFYFPVGMQYDSVAMGQYLNQTLDAEEDQEEITFMVERDYWQFLGIQLTAKHYGKIVFDRAYKYDDRNIPSIFLNEPVHIEEALQSKKVRFVVLRDRALIIRARRLPVLRELRSLGQWVLFRVIPLQ